MLKFTVPGTARPQGSKRHVGGGRMVESSKHVAGWREWVRFTAQQAMAGNPLLTGPLDVTIWFTLDRPKKHLTSKGLRADAPRWHTSWPDVDKLLRAVLDAMTGVVFQDDSQVAAVRCVKWYGPAAKTEVEITRAGDLRELIQ